MPRPAGDRQWRVGTVDRRMAHLQITAGGTRELVALVGRGSKGTFVVEFLESTPEAQSEVRREIDFYLTEVGGPDPWTYAIYHCGTAANLYSNIQWSYIERGER